MGWDWDWDRLVEFFGGWDVDRFGLWDGVGGSFAAGGFPAIYSVGES